MGRWSGEMVEQALPTKFYTPGWWVRLAGGQKFHFLKEQSATVTGCSKRVDPLQRGIRRRVKAELQCATCRRRTQ